MIACGTVRPRATKHRSQLLANIESVFNSRHADAPDHSAMLIAKVGVRLEIYHQEENLHTSRKPEEYKHFLRPCSARRWKRDDIAVDIRRCVPGPRHL
jgi:hypothetical protein